ncbi:ABC-type uncharacterized transport system substrate-binding protein [Hoeflea marina]|uniref:ABC-type uncharacterized transport system substrate-binding protein n=1 Tax=Hoeflea marina TaxID=274592 RepID=A0A317PI39_9HYPH|nr:DUF1007 family protein [Hoeflea marina]PWV99098.1 ABC-type uncharacterized transport system substrate-binding protein [Hoeflea marina]
MTRIAGILGAALVAQAGLAGAARAHPHVWVDGAVTLNIEAGSLASVTNVWTFDAPFSAYAAQGLDTDGDHRLSAAELKPLSDTNMEALAPYHFFTYVTAGGKQSELGPPVHYALAMAKKRLTLTFTLPLATPVAFDAALEIDVLDPEYFVAYSFPGTAPVMVKGEAGNCRARYQPPRELDAAIMAQLAEIPADQHDLPEALQDAAAGLAHRFVVACK